MKHLSLILIMSVSSMICFGQNLVNNPDFEEVSKKVKTKGQIDLTDTWYPATNAPVDLFSASGKDDAIKVPQNEYGDEKAKSGENYIGLLMYSYRERDPRTYVTTKLSEPLEKGEYYCIRFHVSLSDLSKYACNNLGLYVSEEKISEEGTGFLTYEPQVIHSTNRIFNKQWDWETICRIYVAKGGEEYITIGNFAKQDDVQIEKLARPKGYSTPQQAMSYYYIDEVSVTPGGTPANCKCEAGNFAFAHLDMEEKNFESNPDEAPKQTFLSSVDQGAKTGTKSNLHEDIIVPFELAKSSVEAKAKARLDEAIAYLKENKNASVDLIAHIDKSEARLTGLSEKRMDEAKKYLLSQGIDDSRISTSDVGDTQPIDDSGLKENREKNTVVEIKFKQ